MFFSPSFCPAFGFYKKILKHHIYYNAPLLTAQLPTANSILFVQMQYWPLLKKTKHPSYILIHTVSHSFPFQLLFDLFLHSLSLSSIGCSRPLSNLFLFSALRISTVLLHTRDQPITVSISGLEALSTSLAPWKMFWSVACSTLWFPKEISSYIPRRTEYARQKNQKVFLAAHLFSNIL